MAITRVCSHAYPFIGTFQWNYIIIQLPQGWMAQVKVRLSEGCRPTRGLRYVNADSEKLVNWTTGAYGWLESRRSIYQTSNSAKQLYKTSSSSHCLTCICFHAGWSRFRERPEVGHVAFRHFPGSCLFQDTRRLGISILFNIHHPDDLYDVLPSTAAHLMGLRAVCGTLGTIERGPVAIPADPMVIE